MNFSDYDYVPTIRTRNAELLGVKNLRQETKNKILPQFRLSKVNRTTSAIGALDKLLEAYNGPAILQLEDNKALRIEDNEYNELVNPDENFSAWMDFLNQAKGKNEELCAGLIYNSNTSKRDFIGQVKRMESEFGKMVFNFDPFDKRSVAAASTAASVINELSNILFIADSGQITRERQMASLNATISAMNELRSIDASIDIVSSGTSFPNNFPPYLVSPNSTCGVIPMLEWDNYHSFGGRQFAIYGDYASIHGDFYKGSFAQFVARVDYPTPGEWIFERRRPKDPKNCDRPELYIAAANEIITNESWDNELDVWGSQIIKQIAEGRTDGFCAPAKWISVRLNLHIERVLDFLEQGIVSQNGYNDFDEDIDW
ncbi:beta family protein [Vibrio fluvialis]|nr:beta family protein [Vibrio fluvialis]